MRSVLTTTTLLPALLVVVSVADVCFGRHNFGEKKHCMFDRLMQKHHGRLPTAVIKEVSANVDGALQAHTVSTEEDKWEPLRIKVSKKDLEEGGKHCVKDKHFQTIKDFEGKDYSCESYSSLYQGSVDVRPMISQVLEKAIKLHTDRLSVKRAKGKIVLPKFTTGVCQHFTVPEEYTTTGFDDADMVLFVGAIPSVRAAVNGWAVPCAVNSEGRPVAGAINLFPNRVKMDIHNVRSAAHQIAHALGFWHTMMQNLRMMDKLQVRTKENFVAVVKSQNVRDAARKHYGCETAHGMELEDGPDNKDTQSHWEQRNAKDELMADFFANTLGATVLGLYTNLTLSVFEDMGFYKADFSKAEPLKWGRNAGCDFLEKSCWNKNGTIKFPDMFCAEKWTPTCTTDRRSIGICAFEQEGTSFDQWNFPNLVGKENLGNRATLTDYCPVIESIGTSCTNPFTDSNYPKGNRLGESSWCLDGEELQMRHYNNPRKVNGVCAEVQCEGKTIKVRYQGNEEWHDCPDGGSITPQTDGTDFVSGKLKCPKYEEVCTVGKEGESLVAGKTEEAAASGTTSAVLSQ